MPRADDLRHEVSLAQARDCDCLPGATRPGAKLQELSDLAEQRRQLADRGAGAIHVPQKWSADETPGAGAGKQDGTEVRFRASKQVSPRSTLGPEARSWPRPATVGPKRLFRLAPKRAFVVPGCVMRLGGSGAPLPFANVAAPRAENLVELPQVLAEKLSCHPARPARLLCSGNAIFTSSLRLGTRSRPSWQSPSGVGSTRRSRPFLRRSCAEGRR